MQFVVFFYFFACIAKLLVQSFLSFSVHAGTDRRTAARLEMVPQPKHPMHPCELLCSWLGPAWISNVLRLLIASRKNPSNVRQTYFPSLSRFNTS